jgi:hypothetical protein
MPAHHLEQKPEQEIGRLREAVPLMTAPAARSLAAKV